MTARRRIDPADLRRLALAGECAEAISRVLGCAGNSVRGTAKRHGIALRPGAQCYVESAFWVANGERAVDMRDAGASMSEIARAIGTTKNAVAGRFNRLGLCIPKTYAPVPRLAVEFPDAGRCMFPIGADTRKPEFHFCGAHAKCGGPYCREHCRVAYRPFEKRRLTDASL